MTITETDDIWRLYRREWVTVHTIDGAGDPNLPVSGQPIFDQAMAWAKDNLTDRVRQEDQRLVMNTDGGNTFWCHVQVFKDNLKGEFKHADNAQQFADTEKYDEYTVVPRNSKSDHTIRSYGVIKL